MHLRLLFLLLLFLPVAFVTCAQTSDFGIGAGVAYYNGELNPGKPFYQPRLAVEGFFRRNFNPRYAMKINVAYGKVGADDADSKYLHYQQRNISFRSTILEAGAHLEFNFLPYMVGSQRYPATPYVFVGASGFRFNPRSAGGTALQEVPTEYKSYGRYAFAMPFGIGFKGWISHRMGFEVEWGMRKTSTDYLDDVRKTYPDLSALSAEELALSDPGANRDSINARSGYQRGNSKNKDWYSFAFVTLVYSITPREYCPAYGNRR